LKEERQIDDKMSEEFQKFDQNLKIKTENLFRKLPSGRQRRQIYNKTATIIMRRTKSNQKSYYSDRKTSKFLFGKTTIPPNVI
jgi:hypothetical protein